MRRFVLIVLLFSFVFLFGISRYHLWKPDEPRYAEVAREMLEKNSFVVPVLNGRSYYDKPPGFFILTGLSYRIFGRVDEFSARFTSAFFSLASLIFIALFGGRLFGKSEAFLGSVILGTSLEYVWIARRVNMDNVLTFFVIVSILSFYAWYRGGGRFLLGLFYLFMGLGMLVKGPLAFVVPISTALLFLGFRERARVLRMGLRWGIPLTFLPVFVWLFLGTLREGLSYPKTIIGMHVLGMYFTGWSHPRPFYYYFVNFPLGFMPWSFLIPATCWLFFKHRVWRDEGVFLFVVWFVFTFLFLSISKAKRELYLLPAYPAASMIFSCSLVKARDRNYKWELTAFSVFLILLSMFLLYYKRLSFISDVRSHLFLLFFLMGVVFLGVSRVRRVHLFLVSSLMVVFVLTLVFSLSMLVFPRVDRFKYPARVIGALKGEHLSVYLYRYRNAQFNFYLRRDRVPTIYSKRDVKRLIARGKPFFLVVREKHLSFKTGPFRLVAVSYTWGGRIFLLKFPGKDGMVFPKRKGV